MSLFEQVLSFSSKGGVVSRVVSLSQVVSQNCRKDQPLSTGRLVTQFVPITVFPVLVMDVRDLEVS